jgi:pimeloyl-ACP methyl ester carboxylesterase
VLLVFGAGVFLGPFFMKANPRLLATRTPADLQLRYEPVELVPADADIRIRGWLMPAATPKATIVVVHGGGEDNRTVPYGSGLELMRDLVAHGYSVLTIDLRNYGESDASPDGRMKFGTEESNDVVAAVEMLESRDAGTRIGALGFSMGGSTVAYAASKDPRIEAVVVDSAFADSASITANFVEASMGMPAWIARPFLWSAEHLHGVPLSAGRAVDVVGRIAPRPLLVIQDVSDPIVPADHAKRLAAACPGAELWITDTARFANDSFGTHIKSYKYDPKPYVERVTRFFDAAFARPASDHGREGRNAS